MEPRRGRDHLALLAAACIAAALLFARISAEVLQGEHAGFDWAIRGFAMSHQYGWLTLFFRIVTTSASPQKSVHRRFAMHVPKFPLRQRPAPRGMPGARRIEPKLRLSRPLRLSLHRCHQSSRGLRILRLQQRRRLHPQRLRRLRLPLLQHRHWRRPRSLPLCSAW